MFVFPVSQLLWSGPGPVLSLLQWTFLAAGGSVPWMRSENLSLLPTVAATPLGMGSTASFGRTFSVCTFGEGKGTHESDMGPAHGEISIGRRTDYHTIKQNRMTFLRCGRQHGVGERRVGSRIQTDLHSDPDTAPDQLGNLTMLHNVK